MAHIRIAVSDIRQWHGIEAEVLDVILAETYRTFAEMVGYGLEKNIILTNAMRSSCPMVFSPQFIIKEKDNYRVCLNITDATNWGMIMYQFTHMLCHAYCRYDRANVHKHHWFEEAICEAAAMSNLYYIQDHWNSLPLAHHPTINENNTRVFGYLQEVLRDVPKNIPASAILQFINDNITMLELKSITRIWDRASLKHIHGVSYYLCEHVFFREIQRWKAVGYLNLWDASGDKNLIDYIKNWIRHGDSNVSAIAGTLGVVVFESEHSD
ncbi:hypothetical protein KXR87_05905 [Yokenella regensburgei]|uniref:hypothetical protein n=1 Tax=Yokenella regensburgei TaxID=158877 RepID=UPI003F173ED9